MGRKQVGLAIKDDVEPAIAAEPSKQALDHPADTDRQEVPVMSCARADRDVNVMLQRRRRERRALEASVAQQVALEAQLGQSRQHRPRAGPVIDMGRDRKSTRLNSSHANISYAVFCLKKQST